MLQLLAKHYEHTVNQKRRDEELKNSSMDVDDVDDVSEEEDGLDDTLDLPNASVDETNLSDLIREIAGVRKRDASLEGEEEPQRKRLKKNAEEEEEGEQFTTEADGGDAEESWADTDGYEGRLDRLEEMVRTTSC